MNGPACGAKRRQADALCHKQAGWGTDHLGWGPCRLHGGSTISHRRHAETLREEAWARILALTDPALTELAQLITAESEEVRLKACRDVLDRAGLSARHVHELSGPGGEPIPTSDIDDQIDRLLQRVRALGPVEDEDEVA